MNTDRLKDVAANILIVFSSGTRIGSDANEPRTTRLGLVTYNSVATQKADLNQYQSYFDANSGVFDALSIVVDTTESVNSTRGHYKKVVIVYASEYKGDEELDPLPIADRLKASDVNIITVAYQQPGSVGLLNNLTQIASSGFSFSDDDSELGILNGKIQSALSQSNCFCPNNWVQYRNSYSDPASYRSGVCLQLVSILATWTAAKNVCRMKLNTNLATEFNQAKHDFILDAVKARFAPPYQYHIGLNYVSGSWVWTQPTGRQQVPLQQPFMWSSGYPQQSSTQSGVMNQQNGLGTGWQNIATMTSGYNYVCETYACDTDNYCDAQSIKSY
ncbi:hypothetical protein CRE_04226 [Caenorhabditis remanei]|uniref:VWFA domain-containing protein n=1 Tax=Caenorhabditis remanei TaxID=31234 RepID=E3MYU2_CAERE|nr:hypothetical protein CRE_04226 [Caenorhabditis remanei]